MNKPVTEQELIDSSRGERVTLIDVESNIVACTFVRHGLMIICLLDLKNGFTVTGQSACADPANFNEEIGQRLARTDAVNKIWALMGYELKERMFRERTLVANSPVKADRGFRTYIGTKVIHAIPMSRLGYNQLRGWKMPVGEDPNDDGYLVEYADRIEDPSKRVPGFDGYVSWSPKEVFERAYRPVRAAEAKPAAASAEGSGTASQKIQPGNIKISGSVLLDDWRKNGGESASLQGGKIEASHVVLDTWVDRARRELAELTERYEKLEAFLRTDQFSRLPAIDRKDLYVQVNHLEGYKHALSRRLARRDALLLVDGKRAAQQQAQQFQNRDAG